MDPRIAADLNRMVEERVRQLLAANREVAYGIVDAVDTANLKCSVFVSGSATASGGFSYAPWQQPAPGDRVRVMVDPRGDRYLDSVLEVGGIQRIAVGRAPYTPDYSNTQGFPNTSSVAAGTAIAKPIDVPSPMRLRGIRFWSADTTLARSMEARLYVEGEDGVLRYVPGTHHIWSFTAGAAAMRGSVTDGYPPGPLLAPGYYIVIMRNTHGSNSFLIGHEGSTSAQWLGNMGVYLSGSAVPALGDTVDITGWGSGSAARPAIMLVADAAGRDWG